MSTVNALELIDVTKEHQGSPPVAALTSVTVTIAAGEFAGIVGPSGSGKSTMLAIAGTLERPTAGSVRLAGLTVDGLADRALAGVRATRIGFVFQQFFLLPGLTALGNVAAGLLYRGVPARQRRRAAADALAEVGLSGRAGHRPAELSGGECQRVAIARALALSPALIICDEAVSSFDVLIQAQVLNLFERLRVELGLSYLFIAHDLAIVKQVSDRVAVMYLGKLCEVGPPDEMYRRPLHPYTLALLASIPEPDPNRERRLQRTIAGEPPSPIDPPSGCRFRTRCPRAEDRCADEVPPLRVVAGDRQVACHFPLEQEASP
jgi:peptide/nickel transport system ATP-binding protein